MRGYRSFLESFPNPASFCSFIWKIREHSGVKWIIWKIFQQYSWYAKSCTKWLFALNCMLLLSKWLLCTDWRMAEFTRKVPVLLKHKDMGFVCRMKQNVCYFKYCFLWKWVLCAGTHSTENIQLFLPELTLLFNMPAVGFMFIFNAEEKEVSCRSAPGAPGYLG